MSWTLKVSYSIAVYGVKERIETHVIAWWVLVSGSLDWIGHEAQDSSNPQQKGETWSKKDSTSRLENN